MLAQERELTATEYAQLRGTTLAAVKRAFETGRLSEQVGMNDGRFFVDSAEESRALRRERIATQICAAHTLSDKPFDEGLMVEEAVRVADKLSRRLELLDKFDLQQLNQRHHPRHPADASPPA